MPETVQCKWQEVQHGQRRGSHEANTMFQGEQLQATVGAHQSEPRHTWVQSDESVCRREVQRDDEQAEESRPSVQRVRRRTMPFSSTWNHSTIREFGISKFQNIWTFGGRKLFRSKNSIHRMGSLVSGSQLVKRKPGHSRLVVAQWAISELAWDRFNKEQSKFVYTSPIYSEASRAPNKSLTNIWQGCDKSLMWQESDSRLTEVSVQMLIN